MNHTFHIIDTQTGKEPDIATLRGESWFPREFYVAFCAMTDGTMFIYTAENSKAHSCPPGRFLVVFDEPEPKLLRFEGNGDAAGLISIERWGRSLGEILRGKEFRFIPNGDYGSFTAAELAEIAAYLQKKGEGA